MLAKAWNHNTHYHRRLLRLVPDDCERALDVGCGDGTFAACLAAKGAAVIALDSDHVQVEPARRACADLANVSVWHGDFLTADLGQDAWVDRFFAAWRSSSGCTWPSKIAAASAGVILLAGCRARSVGSDPLPGAPLGRRYERIFAMDWKLEVVVVPVTDVDRAKAFYVDKLGFHLDVDTYPTETMRVVQMTPPGSACSVTVGPVIRDANVTPTPGASLQLVVKDIEAARAQLVERGVEASEVQTLDPRDGGKFVFFSDPDDNQWAVQEIRGQVGDSLA